MCTTHTKTVASWLFFSLCQDWSILYSVNYSIIGHCFSVPRYKPAFAFSAEVESFQHLSKTEKCVRLILRLWIWRTTLFLPEMSLLKSSRLLFHFFFITPKTATSSGWECGSGTHEVSDKMRQYKIISCSKQNWATDMLTGEVYIG